MINVLQVDWMDFKENAGLPKDLDADSLVALRRAFYAGCAAFYNQFHVLDTGTEEEGRALLGMLATELQSFSEQIGTAHEVVQACRDSKEGPI